MNNHKVLVPYPGGRADAGTAPRPDPEVVAHAKRRRFTADYKHRFLSEAAQLKRSGGVRRDAVA